MDQTITLASSTVAEVEENEINDFCLVEMSESVFRVACCFDSGVLAVFNIDISTFEFTQTHLL
jgi:hypothetical protein